MQGSPLAAHPCLVFPFVPIFSYFLLAHNVITDYPRKSTIYRFFILCNVDSREAGTRIQVFPSVGTCSESRVRDALKN
ncbi:hypothetical protein J3E69DRAFT_340732 [Trichoderma sp. SZMC 28015]